MKDTSRLLIDEYPLILLPKLAEAIGLNEAIVLQQVHYWITGAEKQNYEKKFRNGRWWVYNTYEQWQKDNFPFWSKRTVQRIFLNLEEEELLIAKQLDASHYDRMKWYTINYSKLAEIEAEIRENGQNTPEGAKLALSSKSKWHDQSDQDGTFSGDNVAQSTLTETASETTSETTSENFISPKVKKNLSLRESSNPDFGEEEIEYVDIDSFSGEESGSKSKRPKWQSPNSELAKKALAITGRKYFPNRPERSRWIKIEKDSGVGLILDAPLEKQPGVPSEWVEFCMEWAGKKNGWNEKTKKVSNVTIRFSALLSFIEDEDKRTEWILTQLQPKETHANNEQRVSDVDGHLKDARAAGIID